MEFASVVAAILAFIAFRQWLQHQRRVLVHKERLVALEKGLELPALEQETQRSTVNVQRLLLFAGLIWIALGAGATTVLAVLLSFPNSEAAQEIPQGMQIIGIVPVGIGLAHLITYLVGRRMNKG